MNRKVEISARQTLQRAAKLIKVRGWCKGHFVDGNGAVCIIGAINRVRASAIAWDDAYKCLSLVVAGSPVVFNDKHCESADDAIAALKIAADLAA